MSLDGLRAWIGEVERKLGVRSRVFLVLVAIAIGGAGAGIYLALDAGYEGASEADVQKLQEQIDALEGEAAAGTDPRVSQLEAELDALRAQVEGLKGKGATAPGGGTSEGDGAAGGSAKGSSAEGGSGASNGTKNSSAEATGEDPTANTDQAPKDRKSDTGRVEQGGTTGSDEGRTDETNR
jgi:hypothetical protein